VLLAAEWWEELDRPPWFFMAGRRPRISRAAWWQTSVR